MVDCYREIATDEIFILHKLKRDGFDEDMINSIVARATGGSKVKPELSCDAVPYSANPEAELNAGLHHQMWNAPMNLTSIKTRYLQHVAPEKGG